MGEACITRCSGYTRLVKDLYLVMGVVCIPGHGGVECIYGIRRRTYILA